MRYYLIPEVRSFAYFYFYLSVDETLYLKLCWAFIMVSGGLSFLPSSLSPLYRCTAAAVGVGDLGALELPTGQSTLKFFRVPTEFSLSITTTSTATGEHALPSRSRPAGRPNHLYWALGQQVIWAAAAEGLSPPENSLCSPSFGIRQNSGDKQANFTPF